MYPCAPWFPCQWGCINAAKALLAGGGGAHVAHILSQCSMPAMMLTWILSHDVLDTGEPVIRKEAACTLRVEIKGPKVVEGIQWEAGPT